jgi:hypothetical protein
VVAAFFIMLFFQLLAIWLVDRYILRWSINQTLQIRFILISVFRFSNLDEDYEWIKI